jgi:hypothetical protein
MASNVLNNFCIAAKAVGKERGAGDAQEMQ